MSARDNDRRCPDGAVLEAGGGRIEVGYDIGSEMFKRADSCLVKADWESGCAGPGVV